MSNTRYKYTVSICVPAYGQSECLRRTLGSIFSQTYKDYEVIVTDDTPGDSVRQVVDEFGDSGHLCYYKNSVRKGSPENWNEAVSHAEGEYIKIMHHDDWFPHKDCLMRFVSMLDEHPDSCFAFSGALIYDAGEKLKRTHSARPFEIERLRKDPQCLFTGNFVGAPSATIYRKTGDIRFDPNLKWVVDIDFYIRLLARNNQFEYSYEPLVAVSEDLPGRVTVDCLADKNLVSLEYLYLYGKLSPARAAFNYIWDLLLNQGLPMPEGMSELLIRGALTKQIQVVVVFLKIYDLFSRSLRRFVDAIFRVCFIAVSHFIKALAFGLSTLFKSIDHY